MIRPSSFVYTVECELVCSQLGVIQTIVFIIPNVVIADPVDQQSCGEDYYLLRW